MSWVLTELKTEPADIPPMEPGTETPLGPDAREFVEAGASIGQQRQMAVKVARNYWGAGYSVEDAADALWAGLQQRSDPTREPWTHEDARAIAEDVYRSPAPPLRPLERAPLETLGVHVLTHESEHLNRAGPVVVNIADVARESVTWRWRDRLPVGKLTIAEGDPGVGKSNMTLAIATAVTLGSALPDDTNTFDPQRVLILTAEDGLGDTIRPRLEDMGADLRLVSALTAVRDADGRDRFPSLVDDVASIESVLSAGSYGLVIVDPINAYLRGVDGHADVDVRSVLAPLAQLAESFGVVVLCVRHLTKSARDRAIYRGAGSIAYTAAARSVLLVGQNPDDDRERVVVCIKHNLAADSPAIGFEINDGRFVWHGESDVTASQLLAPDQDETDRSAHDEAIAFLRDALADGPRPSEDCQREAGAAGITRMTLRRARATLHVVVSRRGEAGRRGGGSWWWALPGGVSDLDV